MKLITNLGGLKPKDKAVVKNGLLSHHLKSGRQRKTETFNIILKNKSDDLVGAIVVTLLWNGMEINSLWVEESLRGKGWGRKLHKAAENEGLKRGATISYTNTFPWQAPKFYEKLGYKLYGKLEGFPEGSFLSYYSKNLK
jgi:ribosomal protein S18 acetylase RimI-like enzyme